MGEWEVQGAKALFPQQWRVMGREVYGSRDCLCCGGLYSGGDPMGAVSSLAPG